MADKTQDAAAQIRQSGYRQAQAQAQRADAAEAQRAWDYWHAEASSRMADGRAWDHEIYEEGIDDEGNPVGPSAGELMSTIVRGLGPNDPRTQALAQQYMEEAPDEYQAWQQAETMAWERHREQRRQVETAKQALDTVVQRREQHGVNDQAIKNVMRRNPDAETIGPAALEHMQNIAEMHGAPQSQLQTEKLLEQSLNDVRDYEHTRKAYEGVAKHWDLDHDPSISADEAKAKAEGLAMKWTQEAWENREEVPEPMSFKQYEKREQEKLLEPQKRVESEWERYSGRDPSRESQREYKARVHSDASGVGAAFEESMMQNSKLQEPPNGDDE